MMKIVHEKSIEEHNKRLTKLLDRIQKSGLTLNKEKYIFRMNEFLFMGHLFSSRRIALEENKIRVVRKPENTAKVRCFLGLVISTSSRITPDYLHLALSY